MFIIIPYGRDTVDRVVTLQAIGSYIEAPHIPIKDSYTTQGLTSDRPISHTFLSHYYEYLTNNFDEPYRKGPTTLV